MVGEKVAVVEKLHTASVCERENLDGQTDKHKIEIIFSVKDSWLSHIFVCSKMSGIVFCVVFKTHNFQILYPK